VTVKSALTTRELWVLDYACGPIERAFAYASFGGTYLVGTAQTGPYRDVDVRTILDDAAFDALFSNTPPLWELLCLAIGGWLVQQTGLPIDYQIQRMTEANEKHAGPRNPLGWRLRHLAGLGDATNLEEQA
jgi:hypothetical protein